MKTIIIKVPDVLVSSVVNGSSLLKKGYDYVVDAVFEGISILEDVFSKEEAKEGGTLIGVSDYDTPGSGFKVWIPIVGVTFHNRQQLIRELKESKVKKLELHHVPGFYGKKPHPCAIALKMVKHELVKNDTSFTEVVKLKQLGWIPDQQTSVAQKLLAYNKMLIIREVQVVGGTDRHPTMGLRLFIEVSNFERN